MHRSALLGKHWFHVTTHFAMDALLFAIAFTLSLFVRFGDEAPGSFGAQWPIILLASAFFSSAIYVAGLYSTHSSSRGIYERTLTLGGLVLLSVLVLIGISYGTSGRPLGRGVVLIGGFTAHFLAVLHHIGLLHSLRTNRERVVYIVTSEFDEAETRLFASFRERGLELVGIVTACGFQSKQHARVLGSFDDIQQIVRREKVQRVLCTNKNLGNPQLTRHFCELRYSGVSVMPLINLCEEVDQCVPLELVTHSWLLNASGEPHSLYIQKLKRSFDIVASIAGLILGAPVLAAAAVAIKLSSAGPIFYRQVRLGRFGRTFHMTKLRTMHTDAEKNGVQWSSAKGDPRVHRVGALLRRYRIDEIPQLWHVLSGDMSFVGPRPERPEMTAQLIEQVPFYGERLMVQPGITGWAQVSYPYGASVLDTRRKLEYDLYYMKHMSVFLDLFILLDTVRTVLCGGARAAESRIAAQPEAMVEWARLKAVDENPGADLENLSPLLRTA